LNIEYLTINNKKLISIFFKCKSDLFFVVVTSTRLVLEIIVKR